MWHKAAFFHRARQLSQVSLVGWSLCQPFLNFMVVLIELVFVLFRGKPQNFFRCLQDDNFLFIQSVLGEGSSGQLSFWSLVSRPVKESAFTSQLAELNVFLGGGVPSLVCVWSVTWVYSVLDDGQYDILYWTSLWCAEHLWGLVGALEHNQWGPNVQTEDASRLFSVGPFAERWCWWWLVAALCTSPTACVHFCVSF